MPLDNYFLRSVINFCTLLHIHNEHFSVYDLTVFMTFSLQKYYFDLIDWWCIVQELAYGGWVAPNIYYLGYAGVVDVNGVRIGGLSGIYKVIKKSTLYTVQCTYLSESKSQLPELKE